MSEHYFVGDNFDDIYRRLLFHLSLYPQHICSPRGSKIKENLAVTLELTDPRARLLSCKKRNTNYGFAVGEFLWYWRGHCDLATMLYYNKRMKDYSDDGKTLNSAYGYRLKNMTVGYDRSGAPSIALSQWDVAKMTLLGDSDSRRAILLINEPADEVKAATVGSKDVPCTLSLQFFIRDGKLDLHVHMRSNDVMWGLTYDLFSFTLFQECMLLDLRREEKFKDLKLGSYYHTAGSLHLYEPHFKQAEEIVGEYDLGFERQPPQKPIEHLEDLDAVALVEQDLRESPVPEIDTEELMSLRDLKTPYWMIDQLVSHRQKRDEEARKKKG